MSQFSRGFKRLFDISLAVIGGVVFSPLALIFSLAVRGEDGGPLFYVQERWGRGGKKFKAYKFRTMVKETGDARITKVGKFLRASAMDELPQLFNIWRGDMSFVGPRALAVAELDPSFPGFLERHEIRPGLTGPAQVHASRDAPLEEKFSYDLAYIRTHSLGGDLKLIFLSFWITLRGKWESSEKKI